MLTQYKNINDILITTASSDGIRYSPEKLALLDPQYSRQIWKTWRFTNNKN